MDIKKNPSLETSTLSNLFFTGGLVVALGLTIFAFEHKTYDEVVKEETKVEAVSEAVETIEDIPVTRQEAAPVAPPPPEPKFDVGKEEKPDSNDITPPPPGPPLPPPGSPGPPLPPPGPPLPPPPPPPIKDEIVDVAQVKATFPGGDKEYTKFLSDNIKYPRVALRNNVEGTVYIKFIVDKDGSIMKDCVRVVKSIDPAIDAEAIRVVRMSPNWTPAKQNERAVRQRIRVPVKFRITK